MTPLSVSLFGVITFAPLIVTPFAVAILTLWP